MAAMLLEKQLAIGAGRLESLAFRSQP